MQGAHNRQPHGIVSGKSEASENMSTQRNQSNRMGHAEAESKQPCVLLNDSTMTTRRERDFFKVKCRRVMC
jgi:hypothetical protein